MNDTNSMSDFQLNEAAIADQVRAQRFRVFRDRWVGAARSSPLGIALIGWIIYLSTGWQRAVAWVALMVVFELSVVWIGHRHRTAEDHGARAQPWTQALIFSTLVSGLVWSASVWFVWSEAHFLLYVLNLCVLVGVSGIAMMVVSPVGRANFFFSLGLLLPPLAQIAWSENAVSLQILGGWLVMFAVQVTYARDLKREMVLQLDATARNQALVSLLTEARADLQQAMVQLNQLVTIDPLTGAYSRRYVFQLLDRHVANLRRHGTPVSIVMLDLDHFKRVNDQYGHPVGDRALSAASLAVTGVLREGDLLARIGGEEFLVLLPMTDQAGALLLAERLRQTLADTQLQEGGATINLPASFGVAQLRPEEDTAAWYQRVDAALYQAKARGRNTVVAAA